MGQLPSQERLREIIHERSVPVPEAGCWIWTASTGKLGYGDFRLGDRHLSAHRASYEAFKGEIHSGLHVLHSCDTRCCVNPDHLSVGTNKDNIHDCCRKGRNSRLTTEQVIEIRNRRAAGESVVSLAKAFNAKEGHISAIATGRIRNKLLAPLLRP